MNDRVIASAGFDDEKTGKGNHDETKVSHVPSCVAVGRAEIKQMFAEMMRCADAVIKSDLLVTGDIAGTTAEVANRVGAEAKLCEAEMEIRGLS